MPNRLLHEQSPYLLQHAHNPVDWYPWGDEAFARAREDDRLIFLSIGYSTCHWCHVMERESFENVAIAAVLNERFVPIKVDREERPDVDRIYMSALQAMGQDGGWPLSIFLTPDLKPVWGGTYFPPEPRHGRSGLPDILRRIDSLWREERPKVLEAGENLAKYLSDLSRTPSGGGDVTPEVLESSFAQFEKTYDREFGGFGGGPKFPRPSVLSFLLRYHFRTRNAAALEMVEQTLRKMMGGGINDHVGGGFHRYAVDREWRVPHFEKMLYDQAQIVTALAETYQKTHEPSYARGIRNTCDYVLRDLAHPEGGFYSAEDADSGVPGEPGRSGEGAFYVWAEDEIREALGEKAGLIITLFGIEEEGNLPADPHQEFGGKNILYLPHSLEVSAQYLNASRAELEELVSVSRGKLFEIRKRRPRPPLDDKVIGSWNGLMISALAQAGGALGEERYLQGARRAAGFVFSRLYDPWNRVLKRRFRGGDVAVNAQLEDYAFLANGLVDLYEATGEIAWLRGAIRLADDMVAGFWDGSEGGFFSTDGKDLSLLARLKEHHDGAEPGGNSVALHVLLRLGRMTGNREWERMVDRGIRGAADILKHRPVMLPYLAGVVETMRTPPVQIIIAGDPSDVRARRFVREAFAVFIPSRVILFADGGAGQEELSAMVPELGAMVSLEGEPTAYLCRDFVCSLPTRDPEEFAAMLRRA